MKNSIKNIFLLLFAVFIFFTVGCKRIRCDTAPIPKIMITQEILDYVDYKAGTYWIYQDSATGRIDSEVVVSSRHYMQDAFAMNDCDNYVVTRQYENIDIAVERFDMLGNKMANWTNSFINEYKMKDPRQDNWWYFGTHPVRILYPFSLGYTDNTYFYNNFFPDSINVNGSTFKNILVVRQVLNSDPTIYNDFGFIKRIGLVSIQKRGSNPECVKLLRHKIQ